MRVSVRTRLATAKLLLEQAVERLCQAARWRCAASPGFLSPVPRICGSPEYHRIQRRWRRGTGAARRRRRRGDTGRDSASSSSPCDAVPASAPARPRRRPLLGVDLGAIAGRHQRDFLRHASAARAASPAPPAARRASKATRSRRASGAVWWFSPSAIRGMAGGRRSGKLSRRRNPVVIQRAFGPRAAASPMTSLSFSCAAPCAFARLAFVARRACSCCRSRLRARPRDRTAAGRRRGEAARETRGWPGDWDLRGRVAAQPGRQRRQCRHPLAPAWRRLRHRSCRAPITRQSWRLRSRGASRRALEGLEGGTREGAMPKPHC